MLVQAGDAWSDRAGGTSGALWGVILRAIGETIGDEERPSATSIAAGVAAASRGVTDYGKAEVGDKTMVDALVPFSAELRRQVDDGAPLAARLAAGSGSRDRGRRRDSRPAAPHGTRPPARREEPRHTGSRRALARPHRNRRRRRSSPTRSDERN